MSKKLVPSGSMPLPLPPVIVLPDGVLYGGKYSSFICTCRLSFLIRKTSSRQRIFVWHSKRLMSSAKTILRRLPTARPYILNRTRPSVHARLYLTPPARHVHVRAISFSSIPRAMARAFRVPLYGAAIGAGGVGYANYKLESVRNATSEILSNVTDKLSSAYNSASQLGSSIQDTLSDTASGVQDTADALKQGTKDWWDAFTSQFSRNQEKSSGSGAEGKQKWRPGEGPGEPNNGGPTGEEALIGLVGAAAVAKAEEERSDPFSSGGGDEHHLLQLTKKLIEIRSVLLSVDQSDALKLPSIVVIGSQSSGKSSVLEAIVGHEFLPK